MMLKLQFVDEISQILVDTARYDEESDEKLQSDIFKTPVHAGQNTVHTDAPMCYWARHTAGYCIISLVDCTCCYTQVCHVSVMHQRKPSLIVDL